MKNISSLTFCAIALTSLGACQSTNANNGVTQQSMVTMAATTPTTGANKPLLEALQARTQGQTFSKMADLPMSGSAKYEGFAQIISDRAILPTTSTELVGKATLEVGFAGGGSMTGTIDDFDDNGDAYGGSLAVTGGAISAGANGPEVRSDLSGTLTKNGTNYVVNGNVKGGFFGPTGESLGGFDDITITSGGTTSATNISLNAERK